MRNFCNNICTCRRYKNKISPSCQRNVAVLENRGISFIGPEAGFQACGENGTGRMAEPFDIVNSIEQFFIPQILKGKKILLTAGPTVEQIDPVRYISNFSSGKMGYAIADMAQKMGAEVTLITGPVHLPEVKCSKIVSVKSACEMRDAVMNHIENIHIYIGAAAVADYRVETPFENKLKKKNHELTINLTRNPDILNEVSSLHKVPVIVGFSAETNDLEENAKIKLINKKIDIIAANLVGENIGFNSENNELLLLTKNGNKQKLAYKSKKMIAYELLTFINNYYGARRI